jgi:broad specificity phosphatase PhoE
MIRRITPVPTPTIMYLVRHAQSKANVASIFGENEPLTEEGTSQAQRLAEQFRHLHFDGIYTSHLKRAQETAAILASVCRTPIRTVTDLQEKIWDSLEGIPKSEAYAHLGRLRDMSLALPDHVRSNLRVTPDMETESEMLGRYIPALTQIAAHHENETILIVSHQTVMRHFLIRLGFATFVELPEGAIPNTAWVRLSALGNSFRVDEACGILPQRPSPT